MSESVKKRVIMFGKLKCGCVLREEEGKLTIMRPCGQKHEAGARKAEWTEIMDHRRKHGQKMKEVGIGWHSRTSKLLFDPEQEMFFQLRTQLPPPEEGIGFRAWFCSQYCPYNGPLNRLHLTCLNHCRLRMFLQGKLPVLDWVQPYLVLVRHDRPRWKKKLAKIAATILEWLVT